LAMEARRHGEDEGGGREFEPQRHRDTEEIGGREFEPLRHRDTEKMRGEKNQEYGHGANVSRGGCGIFYLGH